MKTITSAWLAASSLLLTMSFSTATTAQIIGRPAARRPLPAPLPLGIAKPAQEAAVRPETRLSTASTTPLQDVAVSDSSTTYLVFPAGVNLVDVGMLNHYLVKIEANAVFVRARRKNPPPTPILVRHGSKYWMGRLVFVKSPVLQLYDFQIPTTGLPPNALALDRDPEQKVRLEDRLASLDKAKEEHQAVAVMDNRLVLSLANIRNDKNFTYLRLKVINKSSIDYNVDFTDFELVENTGKKFLGKKKNEARRPLAPLGGLPNQIIAGNSTGYLLYAIPLFAATDQGFLEVTLRELNGARVLRLPVPSKVVNTASIL